MNFHHDPEIDKALLDLSDEARKKASPEVVTEVGDNIKWANDHLDMEDVASQIHAMANLVMLGADPFKIMLALYYTAVMSCREAIENEEMGDSLAPFEGLDFEGDDDG